MPRRADTLLALAAALAAAGVAGSSDAALTAQTGARAGVQAATLTVTADTAGAQIVPAAGMRPGTSRQGTVTVTVTGAAARLGLQAFGVSSAPPAPALAALLAVTVEDVTDPGAPATVYTGTLAGLAAAPVTVAERVAAGDARRLRVTVAWPAGEADPALQGASAAATLRWSAQT